MSPVGLREGIPQPAVDVPVVVLHLSGEALLPSVGRPLGDIGSGSDVASSDSAVAIQAIARLDYALSSRWSLQLEGRYMQSFGQDLAAESGSGISYEADYQPMSLLLGVSWSF